jgi:hypothetical protein
VIWGTYKKLILVDLMVEIGDFELISGGGARVAKVTKC